MVITRALPAPVALVVIWRPSPGENWKYMARETRGAPARARPRKHGSKTQSIQLVDGSRPVLLEEPGQCAIGKEPASGLAARAVVRLVRRVPNALHRRSARGTGEPEAPVDRHLLVEGSHFLGEAVTDCRAQAPGPFAQRRQRRVAQPLDLLLVELLRQRQRREPRVVKDLVRVGVADPAEQSRIGQRALEGVILGGQAFGKLRRRALEDLESTARELGEPALAGDEEDRRPAR